MAIYNNVNGSIFETNHKYENVNASIFEVNAKYQNVNGNIYQTYQRLSWKKLDTSKLVLYEWGPTNDIYLIFYIYPKKVYGVRATFYAKITGNRTHGYMTPVLDAFKTSSIAQPILDSNVSYIDVNRFSPSSSGSKTVEQTIDVDKEFNEAGYLLFGSVSRNSLADIASHSIASNEINWEGVYDAGYNTTTTAKYTDIYVLE